MFYPCFILNHAHENPKQQCARIECTFTESNMSSIGKSQQLSNVCDCIKNSFTSLHPLQYLGCHDVYWINRAPAFGVPLHSTIVIFDAKLTSSLMITAARASHQSIIPTSLPDNDVFLFFCYSINPVKRLVILMGNSNFLQVIFGRTSNQISSSIAVNAFS